MEASVVTKDVLILGAGAVGVYLLWRWYSASQTTSTAAAAPASSAAGAAASAMTAAGASATTAGGSTATPGLLPSLPGGNTVRTWATRQQLASRDAALIKAQTVKADARPEPASPAPAWTGLPVLGVLPTIGTLPANDHGLGQSSTAQNKTSFWNLGGLVH
jgi:hypothetical protein